MSGKIKTTIALGACLAWLGGCSNGAMPTPPELGEQSNAIINGNDPGRGAQAGLGVVHTSRGCTGTLLTNRHVLTARHCVRKWDTTMTSFTTPNLPASVTLDGAKAADDQTVTVGSAFESGINSLNAGDYAIMALDAPIAFDGVDDNFYNPIYAGGDANLVGKSVLCAGYGDNVLATNIANTQNPGTLLTATMTVDSVSGNVMRRKPNASGQIGAGGDSGSTCFYNNQVTGVQSTCRGSGTDLDGSGDVENNEWSSISSCAGASPDAHRAFSEGVVFADVTVSYRFVPELAAGTKVNATVSSPKDSQTLDISSTATLAAAGLRSGWLDVKVDEPDRMFCYAAHTHTPMTGNVTVDGACMSDGLLAVLL